MPPQMPKHSIKEDTVGEGQEVLPMLVWINILFCWINIIKNDCVGASSQAFNQGGFGGFPAFPFQQPYGGNFGAGGFGGQGFQQGGIYGPGFGGGFGGGASNAGQKNFLNTRTIDKAIPSLQLLALKHLNKERDMAVSVVAWQVELLMLVSKKT